MESKPHQYAPPILPHPASAWQQPLYPGACPYKLPQNQCPCRCLLCVTGCTSNLLLFVPPLWSSDALILASARSLTSRCSRLQSLCMALSPRRGRCFVQRSEAMDEVQEAARARTAWTAMWSLAQLKDSNITGEAVSCLEIALHARSVRNLWGRPHSKVFENTIRLKVLHVIPREWAKSVHLYQFFTRSCRAG